MLAVDGSAVDVVLRGIEIDEGAFVRKPGAREDCTGVAMSKNDKESGQKICWEAQHPSSCLERVQHTAGFP